MPSRICLYTEKLTPPYDEGVKIFTYNLFRTAPEGREVIRIGFGPSDVMDHVVTTRGLRFDPFLRRAVGRFRPDAIVYVPSGSDTPASYHRAWMLRRYSGGAPVALIGLQPRLYGPLHRAIARIVRPEAVYVQSESAANTLRHIGLNARIVRAGVDTDRFHPVIAERKHELRNKHRIEQGDFVALHVGHLSPRRNLGVLADIRQLPGVQTIILGSYSTPQDDEVGESLARRGVRVISGYVPEVQEFYQLADVYIFPALAAYGAIHFPLSVLEAMACNLPVITTPFGGLADCFTEGKGLYFAGSTDDIMDRLKLVRAGRNGIRTRELVEPFTWQAVVNRLLEEIDGLAAAQA